MRMIKIDGIPYGVRRCADCPCFTSRGYSSECRYPFLLTEDMQEFRYEQEKEFERIRKEENDLVYSYAQHHVFKFCPLKDVEKVKE